MVTDPPRSDAPVIVNAELPADLVMVPSRSNVAKVCVACKSNVAPLAITKSVAVFTDPVNLMVPADIVVSPEYVLVPDRVKVPAPVLVTLPVEIAIGSLIDDVPTDSIVKLYVPVTALPAVGFKVNEEPLSI